MADWEDELEDEELDAAPVRVDSDDSDEDDWDKDKYVPTAEEVAAEAALNAEKERLREETRIREAEKRKIKDNVYVPLEDAGAEKRRQLELQLQADADMAADMFAGFTVDDDSPKKEETKTLNPSTTKPPSGNLTTVDAAFKKALKPSLNEEDDFFGKFHLAKTADCTTLMGDVMEKITKVEEKGNFRGVWSHFLGKLLYMCARGEIKGSTSKDEDDVLVGSELVTLKELEDLQKKCKEIARVKKVEETAKTDGATKKTHQVNKNTKFDVGGALDERDYCDEEEEWEEGGDWGEWAEGDWTGNGEWKEEATTS